MLPPAFYYFMSLSEFLKKYPHIALKLGEDEKVILQKFIDGKISMANRVKDEHIAVRQYNNNNNNSEVLLGAIIHRPDAPKGIEIGDGSATL